MSTFGTVIKSTSVGLPNFGVAVGPTGGTVYLVGRRINNLIAAGDLEKVI